MIVFVLALLLQATPPIDTTGFSPDQRFWFAVLTTIAPVVLGVLTLVGTVLAILQASQARQASQTAVQKVDENTEITAATRTEVGVVSKKVDGHSEELRAYAERAGRAEGKAEALEQVGSVVPAPPVQVIVDPDARPGGRRKLDPPATSAPVDVDPSSHLP